MFQIPQEIIIIIFCSVNVYKDLQIVKKIIDGHAQNKTDAWIKFISQRSIIFINKEIWQQITRRFHDAFQSYYDGCKCSASDWLMSSTRSKYWRWPAKIFILSECSKNRLNQVTSENNREPLLSY